MRPSLIAVVLALVATPVFGQATPDASEFMKYAQVRHSGGFVLVLANSHHPLEQAIEAVCQEYGWDVDYEDPLFQSERDFVDITKPEWRVAHPGARGQRLLAGGRFQSEFMEPPNTATSAAAEETILRKIVSDYNASGNPGKYRVAKGADGRLSVVGAYVSDNSGNDQLSPLVLDTPISLPTATRGGAETVYEILEQLSRTVGIKVGFVEWGNTIVRSRITLGAENVPARTLLLRVLASTQRPLMLDLAFSPLFGSEYLLTIRVASLSRLDSSGNRTTAPVDRILPKPINPPSHE